MPTAAFIKTLDASGMFYDNINFSPTGVTPSPSVSWGRVKATYRGTK